MFSIVRRHLRQSRSVRLLSLLLLAPVSFGEAPTDTPPNPPRVLLRGYRFVGATAFTDQALAEVAARSAPLNSRVDAAQLEAARQDLTRHYLLQGYVNSGARLPDQDVTSGVVTFEIVEGTLTEIHVYGTRRLRPSWVERRIASRVDPPLRLQELAEAVQRLNQNPNIRRLTATLQPRLAGDQVELGAGILDLRLEEASPWSAQLHVDNYRPPSVGAAQLWMDIAHHNLTRHGDSLEIAYGILQGSLSEDVAFSGLDNLGVTYRLPLTPQDTLLVASYDRRDYAVIQEPFQDLDIASRYWSAGLQIRQPVYQRASRELAIGLAFDRRHTAGTLLGAPFDFTPGSIRGETDVTALRVITDWSQSQTNQALAVRLITTLGLDILDATVGSLEPDGEFVSLLLQAQYVRDLWSRDPGTARPAPVAGSGKLIARLGAQWAPERLLAMEQLSLGGANTVRGYRENYLIRDAGVLTSVELRLGLLEQPWGTLTAGPFVDFGTGWNINGPTPDPRAIASVGLGLQAEFWDRLRVRFDWGYPFNDTGDDTGDAQDLGLHFAVSGRLY